jgi:hypothetical protein
MGLVYWFSWALFIVYEKVTLRLPWPVKNFVLGQFPGEFRAQQEVLRSRTAWSSLEND